MTKKYKPDKTGQIRRNTSGPGTSKLFKAGLKEINAELAKKVKDSLRHTYFTKSDLRAAFDRTKGRCSYCGVVLKATGTLESRTQTLSPTARFMLYYPLETCGKISRENLIAVCGKCKADHIPESPYIRKRVPNVDTLADLIDRLIVEVHKLAWFENKKREEHAKENPDVELIAQWDNSSRDCCELRSILKREINNCVKEFVRTLSYYVAPETRTFRPPVVEDDNTVADEISKLCEESAEAAVAGEPKRADDLSGLKESLKRIEDSHTYDILRRN